MHPLEISEKLMKTAREKANDMVQDNWYRHTNSSGYNMARDLNVAGNLSGYNVTPSGAVGDWIRSKK